MAKNKGKKMVGKGVAGTIGGYAASNAILMFAPICPLACGAWLLANGAMAIGAATTIAGGVKTIYEKGYNDKEQENEKVNNKLRTEREFINDWHAYKVCHFIVDIINNNKDLILDKNGYNAIMSHRVYNIPIDGDNEKLKFIKNEKFECDLKIEKDIAIDVLCNIICSLEVAKNEKIVDYLLPYTENPAALISALKQY